MVDTDNDNASSQRGGSQHGSGAQQAFESLPGQPRPASQASHHTQSARESDSNQFDQVKFKPPPPVTRKRRKITKSITVSMGGGTGYARSTEEDRPFCVRSATFTTIKTSMKFGEASFAGIVPSGVALPSAGWERSQQIIRSANRRYVVVGIIGKEQSVPRETLRPVEVREDLFKQIRKAEVHLRNPLRHLLSLKRVAAFSVYRCHPAEDYHSMPDISDETLRCLAELYRNFRTEKRDHNDRWMNWIHENFNNQSDNPEEGIYALQLLLQWSPLKIIIWSFIPILLSLAIGLWYMINPYPGEDHVAVVQTAWTIASYIVTTAALALASLAAVTQFGSI